MQRQSEPSGESGLRIETIDRRTIGEPDARRVAELLCLVWPQAERTVEVRIAAMLGAWRDYGGCEAQFPRSLVIRGADRVIGHVEISPRTVGTAAGELTVAAIAGVCTEPSVRGRGLGARLVRAAFQLIDDGTFSFALFQNYSDKRVFYEKLGARMIDNRFVNSLAAEPDKNPFWADVAMIYPSTKPWPTGDIDLRGPGY